MPVLYYVDFSLSGVFWVFCYFPVDCCRVCWSGIAKDTALFYCLVLLKLGVQFTFCEFEHDEAKPFFHETGQLLATVTCC